MPRSQLDHIVITAPTLALGVDYVRRSASRLKWADAACACLLRIFWAKCA